MNIGIDSRILERRISGIGRFLKLVLDELPLVDNKNKYFLFTYEKLNINTAYFTNVPTVKSFLPQKLFAPIWLNFILPKYLKEYKIDLFFCVNQQIPLVKLKNVKYILVLHDVIYKVDKNFHPLVYRKYLEFFSYYSVKLSDIILTNSQFSKQDILKYYKVDENKIKVIYHSTDKGFRPIDISDEEKSKIKEMIGSPKHIVLYVGMIENRKNILGILKTADILNKQNRGVKFVLVGKIGFGGDKLLKEIEKRENVVYLRNVDDLLLKKLYNISSAFLFPSFYEGFGVPPLEAMQSGLPVVAANNTALKEIIDSAGLLHDANDYQAFAEDILKLIDDENFYANMKSRGLERAKKFSVNNTVKGLVEAFNSFSQ